MLSESLRAWVFLMAILSGPFDGATAQGWRDVERSRHAFQTLAACETERVRLVRHYRHHPVIGGAVVITGCDLEIQNIP